jgi:nucleotide-binding universal stress UspA family protein
MPTSDIQPRERILVALDASPQSLAALQAAAQLATALHTELHGLFVEDTDLLCMCALPFSREIGSFSAQPRPLDSRVIERQLRARANLLRQRLAQVAETLQLPWSFQVARGRVTDELLAAAENALLLSLGRVGQSLKRAMGGTAQAVVQRTPRPVLVLGREGNLHAPLTLVYTASPSAQRALQLALRLAQQHDRVLQVLISTEPTEVAQALAHQGIQGRFVALPPDQLPARLLSQRTGALILPAEEAALLSRLQVPVIVVP